MSNASPSVPEAEDVFDAARLRRELALEVKRLDILLWKYFRLASETPDGNINAGLLYCKLASRKSTLLGMDAPSSHAMQVIVHRTEQQQLTSTEELRAVVDQFLARSLPPDDVAH